MGDTDEVSIDDDWRSRNARIRANIRRTEEIQKGWHLLGSVTLVDIARMLCDTDAPPPTTEELRWLKDNLIEHQTSVVKLISLIEILLERTNEHSPH